MKGQSSSTRPLARGIDIANQANQAHREPPRQVEEVELLDVPGQPSQLAGERAQQGGHQLGIFGKESQELVAGERDRLRRLERGRRGRARPAVEQRQLPEEVAGLEAGDDGLLPLLRGKDDLHAAVHHDVQ